MNRAEGVHSIIAFLMILKGVIQDLLSRKITNKNILLFFTLSLVSVVVTSGWMSLVDAAMAIGLAFALGLPFYLLKAFGGGDYKLIMAVAPLLHSEGVVVTFLTAFIWGALLGIVRVALQKDWKSFKINMISIFMRVKVEQQALHHVPYSVALLFGFLTHVTLKQMGVDLI